LTVTEGGFKTVEKWDGKETTLEFGIEGDKMVVTLTYKDVICQRIHESIPGL
jgi:hypothetical protein